MKQLYVATLLFALLQFTTASPLSTSTDSFNILQSEKQLVRQYDKKVNSTMKAIYGDFGQINDEILKDKYVQEAGTPLMQKFRRSMADLQEVFQFYDCFDVHELYVSTFLNTIKDYKHQNASIDEDALYIEELMDKLGYDYLCRIYKDDFQKFVSKDILPKYDVIRRELAKKSQLTKFDNKLMKWMNKLLECGECECYLKTFKKATLTPREQFFTYIQRESTNMILHYANNATKFAYVVYYHPKLFDLDSKYRNIIIDATMLWIQQYEEKKILSMIFSLYSEILEHMIDAPMEDIYILTTILDESGFGQPELHYKMALNNFLKTDLLKEFEKFKSSLSKQELRREKQLLERVELLKSMTTFTRRNEAFAYLRELDKRKVARIF